MTTSQTATLSLIALLGSAGGFGLFSGKRFLTSIVGAGLVYGVATALLVLMQGRLSLLAYLPSLCLDVLAAVVLTAIFYGLRLGYNRLVRRSPQNDGEKRT